MAKGRDQSKGNGITSHNHNDWYRVGSFLSRQRSFCYIGHKHVHLQSNKFGSQIVEPLEVSIRPSVFVSNVAPFNITKFLKTFAQPFHIRYCG
jgi:hypothetical protein